jgi:phospholipid transport system transporter-binding protein
MIVRRGNLYLVDGPVTLDNVGGMIGEGVALEGASVVVDLAGVTNADSSALSLLLEWVRQFRRSGRQIAFANLSGNLRSLAELYGVIDLIPTAAD